MADAPFKPSWARHEKDANNQTDAKKALRASDAFEQERTKEMATSKKARDWESSRKQSIFREKPKWVKKQRLEEHEEILKETSKFKQGGTFDYDLTPMPGYILVKAETIQQEVSGILLPEQEEPNTGVVIKASDDQVVYINEEAVVLKCPVKVGDKILFKRYAGSGIAGLEINSKGTDFRLMRWSYANDTNDLLAILT